jgi:hypothetical protein
VCCSAAGAMIAATIISRPVASHTGRNRAATAAFATSEVYRPGGEDAAAPPVRPGALIESRSQGGTTSVHSQQMWLWASSRT